MSEADGFEKDAFSGNWRASGLDIQEKNEFADPRTAGRGEDGYDRI